MQKMERGVTLVALVVTIVILLILAGISIGAIKENKGTIKETNDTVASAERESLIEKIEADLYNERVKTGEMPSKSRMQAIIKQKGYCEGEPADNNFVSKTGKYTIEYSEIIGWK